MKRLTHLLGISFITISIIAGGCGKRKTQEAPPAPSIEVSNPTQRTVVYTFEYPGYLEAEQTVDLVARVSGFLEEIHFKPGQRVHEGQLLFVIEPQPYKDKVRQAEATLESTKSQLAYSKASYLKMKDAVKTNAVSEIDYLQAEANYGEAMATYEEAHSQLDLAHINLNYCYIKAPFSGRISRNLIDQANLVGTETTTLATIYKDSRMFLYFNMAYQDYVKMSQTAPNQAPKQITIQDVNTPEKTWVGTLDYTAPNIDLTTGSLTLRATILNPNGELLSGQYVKVIIPYKTVTKAILIPEGSIGTNQSGRFVYIVNPDNTVEFRHVDVGVLTPDGMREITQGVEMGERYVVEALVNVRPGMKVTPVLSVPK